jgi:hypothetical protein
MGRSVRTQPLRRHRKPPTSRRATASKIKNRTRSPPDPESLTRSLPRDRAAQKGTPSPCVSSQTVAAAEHDATDASRALRRRSKDSTDVAAALCLSRIRDGRKGTAGAILICTRAMAVGRINHGFVWIVQTFLQIATGLALGRLGTRFDPLLHAPLQLSLPPSFAAGQNCFEPRRKRGWSNGIQPCNPLSRTSLTT